MKRTLLGMVLLAIVAAWVAPAVVQACIPNDLNMVSSATVNVTDELPGGG